MNHRTVPDDLEVTGQNRGAARGSRPRAFEHVLVVGRQHWTVKPCAGRAVRVNLIVLFRIFQGFEQRTSAVRVDDNEHGPTEISTACAGAAARTDKRNGAKRKMLERLRDMWLLQSRTGFSVGARVPGSLQLP